jgi:hypothetical protein
MCDAKPWKSETNFHRYCHACSKKKIALRQTIIDIATLPLSLKKKKTLHEIWYTILHCNMVYHIEKLDVGSHSLTKKMKVTHTHMNERNQSCSHEKSFNTLKEW